MLQDSSDRAIRLASSRRRRAFSILYVGLLLLVLFGFVSLAVDLGRVRVARVQLATASDASALAGAQKVPRIWQDGYTNAQNATVTIAGDNVAIQGTGNAVPVVLVPAQDLEFGLYRTGTTPPRFTKAGSAEPGGHTVQPNEVNAVHVTGRRVATRGTSVGLFFAKAIRVDHQDVVTQAIAVARGASGGFGFVGLDWVSFNGTTRTDSYNAAAGPYGGSNIHSNGSVASNGSISLVGTSDIYGDARPGVDQYVSTNGNAAVHGWAAPLDVPLNYPPKTLPSGLTPAAYNGGDLNLAGGAKSNPVQYAFTNLVQRKKDVITVTSGYVEVYITGSIDMEGGADTNVSALPEQLTIIKVGTTGTIDVGGGSDIRAHIYAPQSDIRFHGTNKGGFYGWMIGKTLDIKGNSELHYDETLPSPFGPPRAVLVK